MASNASNATNATNATNAALRFAAHVLHRACPGNTPERIRAATGAHLDHLLRKALGRRVVDRLLKEVGSSVR